MSSLFLRIITHLLPNARAWRITVGKKLRQFFEGLSSFSVDIKAYFDLIFLDIFPDTTRELSMWEQQFGLPDTGLTEAERRERLAATWRAIGGQSPSYIQQTLRDAGFDVYIHEWWEQSTAPLAGEADALCGELFAQCGNVLVTSAGCHTARNPLLHLRREYVDLNLSVVCGEAVAACGELTALCGASAEPLGYPLVNKVYETVPDYLSVSGEPGSQCGEAVALCGNYSVYKERLYPYVIPNDPTKWPYFLYIGGEAFGTFAQVPWTRRNEFETLCLKIAPSQQWLGIMVEYN